MKPRGVILKPLVELLKIKNGRDYKHLSSGNIPVYGSGGVIAFVNDSAYDGPSVLIPRKGSLEKLYYVDTPFWTVDTCFYTEINKDISPKYIYYCLQKEHLEKLNNAGGIPSLTQEILKKVRIPVPSLTEQKRIVSILDCFDSLCNDKSLGIHAEIEARSKQYEYYGENLFSYKNQE